VIQQQLISLSINEKEHIKTIKEKKHKSLRGIFNKSKDSSEIHLEDNAWKNHILNKFKLDDFFINDNI